MLETSANKDIGNSTYAEKRRFHERSSIGLTRAIAEHYAEWTEVTISRRQQQMARMAKGIWNVEI